MNKSGFSLVELLVATGLVCILFAVTGGAMAVCFRASDRMEKSNVALSLARSKLDNTIHQEFLEIDNEASEPVPGYGDYTQQVTVEAINAQGIPQLKRVTVTVSSVDGSGISSLTTIATK